MFGFGEDNADENNKLNKDKKGEKLKMTKTEIADDNRIDLLRIRNGCILAKIEDREGIDAKPDPLVNGILVESPKFTPQVNMIETHEVSGSLDHSSKLAGGAKAELTFDVLFKTSGKEGVAPSFAVLLKACGFEELVVKAAQAKYESAVALEGNTLTLGATNIEKEHLGLPIIVQVGDKSETITIVDYDKDKKTLSLNRSFEKVKDAKYQIPASIIYKPHSGDIPSLTFYYYLDKVLYKIVGARGNMQLNIETGGIGRFSFTFSGMIEEKLDEAVPKVKYNVTEKPALFKDSLLLIEGKKAAIHNLSLDIGNKLTNPDNPNAKEGFSPAIITERNISGSIDPFTTLVGTRNTMQDFLTGQARSIYALLGHKSGERIAITIPSAMYTSYGNGDREGIATEDVQFDAIGQNSGLIITIF